MSELLDSLNKFYNALQTAEKALERHKSGAMSVSDRIFGILRSTDEKLSAAAKVRADAKGLQEQIGASLAMLKHSIGACGKNLEEKSRIREMLEKVDDQSRAIVIVFGRTNAGKSTLGNFLRGQSLAQAEFANPWKDGAIKPGPIKVIETAAEGEKASEREWFKEGASETTEEIQCFTLPGLLWVDTPGIGSVNDKKLGQIARKYAANADLVIYLDHSDNPGLSSISGNLVRLLENGQETLIVINQSDKAELVRDANGKAIMENGKPKRVRIPKPEEDRRAQEQQEIKSLRGKGFKSEGSLSALSISVLLAKLAVEQQDDRLYAGSAFGKFLEQLSGIIGSEERISRIMGRHLYSACLELCNMSLKGPDEKTPGLLKQHEDLRELLEKIKELESDFNIADETVSISRRISLEAAPAVRKLVNEQEAKLRSSNARKINVGVGPLLGQIQRECNKLISERITEIVRSLFESVEFQSIALDAKQFADFQLERRTEVHEYEVPKSYRYKRSPRGLFEHVASWFGKEYYGVGKTTEKRRMEIDLGFNLDEALGNINAHLDKVIPATVEASLTEAKSQTLGYAREKVENAITILESAAKEISGVKAELEKEIERSKRH